MEKYYELNKAELCVGLDYEVFIPERNCWSLETFYLNESHLDLIKKYRIRVKCLDREDIESLGWKHDFNDDGEENPNQHDKHGYSMGFSIDLQDTPKDICYVLYYFPDNFMIIDSIYKCGSGREEMLFRGYIKNKSELRRLMQQLMITAPN